MTAAVIFGTDYIIIIVLDLLYIQHEGYSANVRLPNLDFCTTMLHSVKWDPFKVSIELKLVQNNNYEDNDLEMWKGEAENKTLNAIRPL